MLSIIGMHTFKWGGVKFGKFEKFTKLPNYKSRQSFPLHSVVNGSSHDYMYNII